MNVDTSAEGLVALLRESNHLAPGWPDPLEVPENLRKTFTGTEPDEFGAWMLSLPLRPWEKE